MPVIAERRLDDLEEHMVELGNSIDGVFAIQYQGKLDQRALGDAFRFLCTRHPVLRAKILDDKGRHILQVAEGNFPAYTIVSGDLNTVRQDFANNPHRLGGALARLVVVRGPVGGYVLFCASHVIVDGGALFALQAELWQLYSEIVSGSEVFVDPGKDLPRSPSATLMERWIESGKEAEEDSTKPADRNRGDRAFYPDGIGRLFRLNSQETSRLVHFARSHSTSVGAVIMGEMACAMRSIKESITSCASTSISIMYGANLRKYASPPLAPTETTYFVGAVVESVNVPPEAEPIDIGRKVKDQLDSSINRRDLLLPGLSRHDIEVGHMCDVAFNNLGTIPQLVIQEDFKIVDFFLRQYLDDSLLVPEFPRLLGVASTFNGELSLWLAGRSEIKQVIESIGARLKGRNERSNIDNAVPSK